jgi:Na+/H+ antiporter NhaD/arsenite permease-like protein
VEVWIAALIFVGAYTLIATERVHKTVAALLGGVLMIVLGVMDQEEAFAAIDLNVIFLLLGMMVIANIMRGTGVFQWLAIRALNVAGAQPWRIMLMFALVTAIASALLDNVTTVVLIAPITLYVAAAMRVSPVPYLIAEILASNIGGASTLIGDPPNILIASAAGIDFVTFAANMVPIAVIVFIALIVLMRVMFRRELAAQRATMVMTDLDPTGVINDPRLMRISVAVMLATLVGFVIAGLVGFEPATVALLGATVLLVLARLDPAEIFAEVEWGTLLFFVGLFILVEGIIHVGIIDALADWLFAQTGGDLAVTSMVLLWFSGIASGIVDNIPYTATLIPVVQQLVARGMEGEPLWWSLALGADLGGNGTVIGASANVIIVALALRAGSAIHFRTFLRYGVPVVAVSLILSSIYVWLRYLT